MTYSADKIKFVAKVEVDDGRMEGMSNSVVLVKEPIYAQDDLVVFLLLFEWYPNSVKTLPKIRKGSFSS